MKYSIQLEKLFDEAYNQIMQDENDNRNNENYKLLSLNQKRDNQIMQDENDNRNNENYKLLSLNQKREKALSMAEIQIMKILKKGA